jgi:hypothetical protein
MLQSLSELYARRAREFSDTVASLGRYHQIEPGLLDLFAEIRRKRHLCVDAEEKLARYLDEVRNASAATGD